MVSLKFIPTRAGFTIIAWVIGWSTASLGADYYVATDGADENAGTSISAPFRTIQRAGTNMVAGDNCYLRGGTYRETLAPSQSGTPLAPITFSAYSNEVATISAADEITGWTGYSGSIYRAAMGWDLGDGFNQVFVDGQMMVQARFPNTGLDPLRPVLADMTASTNSITCGSLDQPEGFWTGGIVVGGFGQRWSFQCAKITASGPGSLSFTQRSYPWFSGSGQGYVCGVLGALDTTNEWHYQSGTLYLRAPDDGTPAAHLVEAKRRAWCVDINGQSNIVVRGLKCFAGSVRVAGNACTLEGCTAQYLSHFTQFTWSGSSSTGGVTSGHNGVLVSGTNNLLTNCWFQYSAGSGVVLQGASNTVTRCVIRDTDYSGTYSCPLSLRGRNNRIHFNSMFNTGRDVIQLFGSRGDDLRYNDLYNCGLLCQDVGVTYQWGVDGQGTRIAYNWIHDNLAQEGPGIYLDGYCRNFVMDHNVIWNCDCAGIRINRPATNHLAYNNTLFACWDIGAHTYDAWSDANPDPGFWTSNIYQYASSNNLFLGSDPAAQLRDYAQADFRLKPGAAAMDAGVAIPGFTDGYSGAAPDRGAYESDGLWWTAGTNGVAEVMKPLPPGLLGWWPGDGNANDLAGTNHGTLQGGATAGAPGLVGSGFTFDGTNGYVEIPDAAALKPANLTVEAWVRFSSLESAGSANSGQQYIVFQQNSRSADFEGYDLGKWRNADSQDVFAFRVTSASGIPAQVCSTTLVTTGVWYHVAAVRGANLLQLYVNGQLQGQTNVGFSQDYGANGLFFGSSGQPYWDRKFSGTLDEVSLYERALSSGEVAAVFAAGAAGKCKAPIITTHPRSQVIPFGSDASFAVTALGPALSYQWFFDGANVLAGATNSFLTLAKPGVAQSGRYSVRVSNSSGALLSQPAVLTVQPPPGIAMPLWLSGTIGSAWRIEYVRELRPTNDWVTLALVTLTNTSQVYCDDSALPYPQRFYRIVPLP